MASERERHTQPAARGEPTMQQVAAISDEREGVFDARHAPLTAGLLLVVSAVAFEAVAVATALPAVSADLGMPGLYGWAFTAFMLGSLVSAVAASQAADRRGPARPFLACVLCFTVGLAAGGVAPSMPVLVAARGVQGLGAGGVAAMAYVCISRGYTDALRARMMALLSSAWVMPALVGPLIAGTLTDYLSWRLVFLGLLPLPFVATALILPSLRGLAVTPDRTALPSRGQIPAALALATGVCLVFGGIAAPHPLLGGPLVLAGLVLAAPALRRLLPAGTLRAAAGLPAGVAARGLLNFGYFGAEVFLPLALTDLHGWSATGAGLALTVAGLTWTAGSWLQARMDSRDGGAGRQERVATGFRLILAGSAVMAGAVLVEPLPPVLALAGWGIAALGMGIAYSTVSLLVLHQAPTGQEGAASGAMQVSELLCVALAAGLGNAIIALARGLDWGERAGIGLAYALAMLATALGLLTARRLQRPAGDAPPRD